jgi:thiopeptide-type bacteriocin biosynthesis protein
LDHFFASWGYDFAQRQQWTHAVSEKYAFSKEFRPERQRYCALLSPASRPIPVLQEQRTQLLELLEPQSALLADLGHHVRRLEEAGKLWVPEAEILHSLAHMHLNRLLGVDAAREQRVYAFWRHTLDALLRMPEPVHASSER